MKNNELKMENNGLKMEAKENEELRMENNALKMEIEELKIKNASLQQELTPFHFN